MLSAANLTNDPRLAHLEALIEKADSLVRYQCHLPMKQFDDVMPMAQAADAELDAYVASLAAVRPQTFAEIALQAVASRYWHERLRDNIEVTQADLDLVASILDAAGIVPKSFSDDDVYARAGISQDDDDAQCLAHWRGKVGLFTPVHALAA